MLRLLGLMKAKKFVQKIKKVAAVARIKRKNPYQYKLYKKE